MDGWMDGWMISFMLTPRELKLWIEVQVIIILQLGEYVQLFVVTVAALCLEWWWQPNRLPQYLYSTSPNLGSNFANDMQHTTTGNALFARCGPETKKRVKTEAELRDITKVERLVR
jgi:hypothetical protein